MHKTLLKRVFIKDEMKEIWKFTREKKKSNNLQNLVKLLKKERNHMKVTNSMKIQRTKLLFNEQKIMSLFLMIQIDWNQPCYERWIGSSVVARKHRGKRRWNETRSKRKRTKRPTNGFCSQGCWIPRCKSFHTVGKIVILHRTLSISHSTFHRSLNLRSLSINLKKKKTFCSSLIWINVGLSFLPSRCLS